MRTLLTQIAFVGIFAMACPCSHGATFSASKHEQKRPYQDLHIPEAIHGKSFNLTLHKSKKSFWEGAITSTYAYNNEQFWGPTLFLNQGDNVQIHVQNKLEETTTSHWHGLHLPAAADGGPHQGIASGTTWTAAFKVTNHASTYWYHPHIHGNTQRQLTMGAGGFIIVKDPQEARLNLPRTYGVDDIPLVLTSRRFYKNNEFTHMGDNDKYGDYEFVNGTLDAQVKLPAQWVRLRILNTETERGYILGFRDNRTFYQIATDGGLVDKPVPLQRITLMTGERAEILVNLSKDKVGSSLDLAAFNSNQPFGFPGGEDGTSPPNGSYLNNRDFNVLHINVGARTANPVAAIPQVLTQNRFNATQEVTNRRKLTITADGPGSPFSFDNVLYKMEKVNQIVKLGAVEEWTVTSNFIFGHSFHIHDVQFNLVSRSDGPVQPYERGWKDTVYIPRGQTVTFRAKFEDYASNTDAYMYHCHMSNHEDLGLMGQFLVVKDPSKVKSTLSLSMEHTFPPDAVASMEKQAKTMAPEFEAADVNGDQVSLRKASASKPVLIFFIQRDCPCSKEAAPFISQLAEHYRGRFTVVGVIDSNARDAKAWILETGAKFTVVPDPQQAIIHAYKAPTANYLTMVDARGRIYKSYPGVGRTILTDLNIHIAAQTKHAAMTTKFDSAPKKPVIGCTFPVLKLDTITE